MTRKAGTLSLVVLVAINILNFYDRHVAGALAEPIRKEFALSDTQLGLMTSAFIWLYALVGLPLGWLADTRRRKPLLAGGMIVWTALTAFASIVTSYSGLLFSRFGVAFGEAVVAPAATSWIGDLFPPERRSRALALFMLGVPVGGALSYFSSGPLAQAFGWRTAMVFAAVPAIVLVPLLLAVREPERGASEQQSTPAGAHSTWSILRIPTLWWIIASGALVNFNMYAIGAFLPAFLSRVHGLSLAKSGVATGVAYAVGGICGGIIAGFWGDRIVHKRKDGRMLSAAAFTLAAAPFAYFGITVPLGSLWIAVALLTVAYGALNTYYGLVYSSIQDIVPPPSRGTTMAIYFMAMYLCGASFGPLITGNLSDRLARHASAAAGSAKVTEAFRAIGLQQAMLVIPVLAVALALVLYAGSRTIGSDISRRDAALKAAA